MDKANFWIALIGFLIFLLITGLVIGPKIWRHFQNKTIQRVGVEASARIIDVIDTGHRANYNPEVVIKLKVQPEGSAPYDTEVRAVVSVVGLQALRPGTVVKVIVP